METGISNIDVKTDGTIYIDGKLKVPYNHSKGYDLVWYEGKNRRVHRLVAETYLPNPLKKCCINHINGDKKDNRVENLEWVNSRENNEHARLNGLQEEKQLGIPDLTEEQVKYIRENCGKNKTCYRLSKEFNRDYKTIEKVCKGLSYKDI